MNKVINCTEVFIPKEVEEYNKKGYCKCRYIYTFELIFKEGKIPISIFHNNYFSKNGFKTYEIANKVRKKYIGYEFKNIFFKVCKFNTIFLREDEGFVKYFKDINEIIRFFKNNNMYKPILKYCGDHHTMFVGYTLNEEGYTIYPISFNNEKEKYKKAVLTL